MSFLKANLVASIHRYAQVLTTWISKVVEEDEDTFSYAVDTDQQRSNGTRKISRWWETKGMRQTRVNLGLQGGKVYKTACLAQVCYVKIKQKRELSVISLDHFRIDIVQVRGKTER
jgi:hypothetical protein